MTNSVTPKSTSDVFEQFVKRVGDGEDFIDHDGTLQVQLKGKHGDSWVIDLSDVEGKVYAGRIEHPDCTITLADEDFLALASGEMTLRNAFQAGKLQMEGDTRMASALMKLFQ